MAFYPNGQTGETGWARLQRREEAQRLYTFLVNNPVQGRRLRIHLFDTSASPPLLIAHNCGPNPCVANTRPADTSQLTANPPSGQIGVSSIFYARQSPAYAAQAPSPYSYPAMPASVPQTAAVYSMPALETGMANMRMSAAIDPAIVAVNSARFAYPQHLTAQQTANQTQIESHAQGPCYVSSSTGTHVNVSQGAIKTEVRGIFVSNVDYKASSKDLQRYFGRAGEIVKCQLQKDPATGKSKGNATVQYAVAKDARNAVRLFHSEKYMGMRLKVRLDKEPVAVGTPSASSSRTNGSANNSRTVQQSRNNAEPIIVNGSMCQS